MNFDDAFDENMSSSSSHGFQITRKAKKRKIESETYPEILEMNGEFDQDVPETVVQKHFFNRENESASYKHVSPWDHSFVASLIQRPPIPTYDMNDNQRVDKYRDSIEGVTREYEEGFMVEPSGDQRPCCMGEECEGKFICQVPNGFVLREFLLPSQQKAYEETKRYPIQRAPCILCKRLQIARLLVSVRAAGTGMREDCLVQDYYNFVNIPGEYRLEDCILSKKTVWEGIVSPVVLHVRNAYKFVMKEGKRGYTQWKMPFLTLLPASSAGTSHSSTSRN
tara:strand:+ start:46 stop:885 length:840 start_codon:yes stop_codon:yes gene_type:complete